jgi:sarcosine oxidase
MSAADTASPWRGRRSSGYSAAASAPTMRAGAELRGNDQVHHIVVDDCVTVTHDGGTTIAETCVVTNGAWADADWLADALPAGVRIPPLRVTQEQVGFFRPMDPATVWPTFVDRSQPSRYGLPTPDRLIKIGEHHTGPVVDPDDRPGEIDLTTWDRLLDWVREDVPGVHPEPVRRDTCLYAGFPGDTFVLDRAGPIVVGLGLSGHGFKFLPEIGRRLADLADGLVPTDNPFAFDRPDLVVGASGHR